MRLIVSAVASLLGCTLTASAADPPDYARDIKTNPGGAVLLPATAAASSAAALRLDTAAAILKGGEYPAGPSSRGKAARQSPFSRLPGPLARH